MPSASAAAALPFLLNADNSTATTLQRQKEWTTIKSKPFGTSHPASFYEPFTTMHLQQADIDSLLAEDLAATEHQLSSSFSNYSQPAKEGLIDMAYTQGVHGLNTGFPNFAAAVRKLDWATAANECNRPQLDPARNSEVRNLFLSVAKPIPTPKPTPSPHPGTGSTGAMHRPLVAVRHWLDRIPVPEPAPREAETEPSTASASAIPADPQAIVAIVAMNSNVSTIAITAIAGIATRK